ncbi:MAG: hypothetical protein U5L72_01260 [Bacteroidales bacterium]|nr:hypothetical protein [Bacteroidales bacterium]
MSYDLWNRTEKQASNHKRFNGVWNTGLAREILRLFRESDVIEKRIIIMGGDRAGILTFGNDMDEAMSVLMQYIKA